MNARINNDPRPDELKEVHAYLLSFIKKFYSHDFSVYNLYLQPHKLKT